MQLMKNETSNKRSRINGAVPTRAELLAAHQRALERVDKMSAQEGFDLLVRTGIYSGGGKLTRRYGGRAKNQAPIS
jgi:hypothetical protein